MKHIKKSVLVVLLTSHVAHASIVVGGTRLVFDGNNDESSINVENKDSKANLVQSWLSVANPRSQISRRLLSPRLFFALMPAKEQYSGYSLWRPPTCRSGVYVLAQY